MRAKIKKIVSINHLTKFVLLSLLILVLSSTFVEAQEEKDLNVELSDLKLEPGESFKVTVTDENGTAIEGARISIDGGMIGVYTGEFGTRWLTAPSNEGLYSIVVEKEGYNSYENDIKVDAGPALWETTTFPIILGGLCLIGAIIFVYFREKRSIYNRATQISKENIMQKYAESTDKEPYKKHPAQLKDNSKNNYEKKEVYKNPYHPKPIRSTHENDSKVEEIRIRRPRKEREVVSVEEEKDVADKVISDAKMKKNDEEWFHGNEEAKYEVGKITGEVDEEKIDKWFEGVDNIKEKIDEKVKKDKKKRKKEEDDD